MDNAAGQTGLRISIKKTQVLKINVKQNGPLKIKGQNLEEVETFTYLGSKVNIRGGAEEDVKVRIGKARAVFSMLSKIWKSKALTTATKLIIFNSNVKSVLLYGSETWKTTKETTSKIQVFINTCLRRTLNVWWPNKISNEDLWDITGQVSIPQQLLKSKWQWLGHTLRKPRDNITRQALQWNPQGRRRVGRPRNSWRRDLTAEIKRTGYGWAQLEQHNKTSPPVEPPG
jgi:hypothetical protein